ncbi:MAG: N4-gp56 family major capsid protein, partial [Bilophila sp.]
PNSTDTMTFRGYDHLPNQPKPLIEGVTPASSRPTFHDIKTKINQFGDWVELTDKLTDLHEDPLISEFSAILGEQAAIMRERITAGVVLGGTNVHFCGQTGNTLATSRAGVNKPISLSLQRAVVRDLKRNLATPITSVIKPSPNFDTSAINSSYVAICHTDMEADIRELKGFVPAEKYASYQPLPGELGSVESVRYLATTVFEPWVGTGAAGTGIVASGGCADVYPILYLGKNAFGVIPFSRSKNGTSPIMPTVLNPNIPRGGDPLGQRGSIGWKMYHGAVILYELYMARAEVAVTAL